MQTAGEGRRSGRRPAGGRRGATAPLQPDRRGDQSGVHEGGPPVGNHPSVPSRRAGAGADLDGCRAPADATGAGSLDAAPDELRVQPIDEDIGEYLVLLVGTRNAISANLLRRWPDSSP